MKNRMTASSMFLGPNGQNEKLGSIEDDDLGYDKHTIFFSFFSLIYEINKLHIWNQYYFFFQWVVMLIQIAVTSYWPLFPSSLQQHVENTNSSIFNKVISNINMVVSLSTHKDLLVHTPTRITFVLLMNLVSLFWIIFAIFYIRGHNRISKVIVYISAFVFHILIYIFFIPTINAFAVSIPLLVDGGSIEIISFIGLLFLLILSALMIHVSLISFPYSASPNKCLFTTFDGFAHEMVLLSTGYQIIFSYISLYFNNWCRAFVISVHILVAIFLMYSMFQVPYVYLTANIIIASFYMSSLVNDVLALLCTLNIHFSETIRVAVPAAVFVVFCVIFTIIFRHIRKKCALITNNSALATDSCDTYLQSLKIKTASEAMRLTRIGFSVSSRAIFDGTMPIYFSKKFDDVNMWFLAASLFSFIPGERENFQFALQKLKSKSPSHVLRRIRLMGLMKLDQYRNFVATLEFDRTFLRLQELTHDAITCVKQFWANTAELGAKVNISTLCNVANHVHAATDMWSEILMIHPNEQSFIELYSIFQVECLGKIEKGIQTQIRSEKVQKGQSSEVDPLFRVFIITKPDLLKKGIVGPNGKLAKSDNETKASEVSYKDEVAEGYGEMQEREEEQFEWVSHRIQLDRATFHFRPNCLSFFRFLSVFAVIVWLVLLIVGLYLAIVTFSSYNMAFERSNNFVKIEDAFSLGQSIILLQWASDMGLIFSRQLYNETLTNYVDESTAISPYDLANSLDIQTDIAQKCFLGILKGLSSPQILYDEFFIVVVAMTNPSLEMYYCSWEIFSQKMLLSPRMASVKSAMLSIVWNQQFFDNQKASKSQPVLCELNLLYMNTPSAIYEIVYKLDSALDLRLKRDKSILNIYVAILCITSIIIWVPLIFTPTFLIHHEINRALKAMLSVSQEGATEASNFISKNEGANILITGRVTDTTGDQRNGYASSVIVSQFLPYFMIILVIVLGAIPHYYMIHTIEIDVEYQKKEHLGALRVPMCSDLLATGILYVLNNNVGLSYINTSQLIGRFSELIENITATNNRYIKEIANTHEIQRTIHFVDKCAEDETSTKKHSFYSCLGLERGINTFLVMARSFLLPGFTFSSTEFIDLLHFGATELHDKLLKSVEGDLDIQNNLTGEGQLASICFFSISIALLIVAFSIIVYFDYVLLHLLKTAMLLIRHLPPPAVAECPKLIDLLVKQRKSTIKKKYTVSEIIFERTSTPIICVGDGFIIEVVNKAFADIFKLDHNMLVGHPLSFVIPRPDSGTIDLSIEEQGAFHLFEKMELMQKSSTIDSASYATLCICNDEYVPAQSTAYPVRESNGDISNYVVFIEDRRSIIEEEKKLESAKRTCDALMNQLVPRDIANFTIGKKEFAFISKKATIVAVQITSILEIVAKKLSDFDNIISDVEAITRKNPPFFMMKTVFDTIFLVGGLFQDGEILLQANAALTLARSLKTEMNKILPNSDEKRFAISIVIGGPILSGLVGTENPLFEVSGAIIDEAAELSSMSPKDEIIISDDFKQVICDGSGEDFTRYGPMIFGRPTYLL